MIQCVKLVKKYKSGGATTPGLYANIHAKKKRIAAGSGEKMRKAGSAGAPTNNAFKINNIVDLPVSVSPITNNAFF